MARSVNRRRAASVDRLDKCGQLMSQRLSLLDRQRVMLERTLYTLKKVEAKLAEQGDPTE